MIATRICQWCEEPMGPHDRGRQDRVPMHRECILRVVFGSVGHQKGLCSCDGGPGTEDDPPGTRREAARAAAEMAWTKT